MFPSTQLVPSSPQLANALLTSITLPKQEDYTCLVLRLVSHDKVCCTWSMCVKSTLLYKLSQKSNSVLICSVAELQINSYFRLNLNTVSVGRSELNYYSDGHLENSDY